MSSQNSNSIVDERPVIARMLVGTIVATALVMVIGVLWAATGAPKGAFIVAAIGMLIAPTLVITTALPLECKFDAGYVRSIPCRLQGRRFVVDGLAGVLALAVLANLITSAV